MTYHRICVLLAAVVVGCGLFVGSIAVFASSEWNGNTAPLSVAPRSPELQDSYLLNPNFECANGTYTVSDSTGQPLIIPQHWTWAPISSTPKLISTRIRVTGNCDPNSPGFVDRIEGEDSFMFRSADIETPPVPGKPFDVAIAQRISVTAGADYSISGFMASFCGGSASPNDCPDGYYISKMIGLDPNGGSDPLAPSVQWADNREPHTTAGYANVSAAARANSSNMTVFVRIHSPFQWHGNHAIVDDFRMIEAPTIAFFDLPRGGPTTGTMDVPLYSVTGRRVELRWEGRLTDDIQSLGGETYQLKADVQYRRSGESAWQNMVTDHVGDGCEVYVAPALNEVVQFRVGALAARPTTGGHRFRTRWSDPVAIQFLPAGQASTQEADIARSSVLTSPINQLFLPIIDLPISQSCSNLDAEANGLRVHFPEGKLEIAEDDLTMARGETIRFLVDAADGEQFVFDVLADSAQSITGDAMFPNGEPYGYGFGGRLELASSRTTTGDFLIRLTNESNGPISYGIRVKRVLYSAEQVQLDSLLAKFEEANVAVTHSFSNQRPTQFDELFDRDISTREILRLSTPQQRVDVYVFSDLATADEATALIEPGSNHLIRTVDGATNVAKLMAHGGAVPYWWRDGLFLLFTSSPDPAVVEQVSAVLGEPLGQTEMGEVNLRLRNASDAAWQNVTLRSAADEASYGLLPSGIGGYRAVTQGQTIEITVEHEGLGANASLVPLDAGNYLVDLTLHEGELRARPFRDQAYMTADDLIDKTWIWERLERVDGTTFVPHESIAFSPSLRFFTTTTPTVGEAGLLFGADLGCNGMGGLYFVNAEKDLLITNIVTTAMGCQEPWMANDEIGMNTLMAVDHYEQEGDELRLITLAGDQLVFSQE